MPVYGESPHLGALLTSLKEQSQPVEIRVASSNCGPAAMAQLEAHGLSVERHDGGSIGKDWNEALRHAQTPFVFIAHQDDRYLPDYSARLSALLAASPTAGLAWCEYAVIDGVGGRGDQKLPLIKRALVEVGTAGRTQLGSERARRWVNAFGPVIGCPTVMFRTNALRDFSFNEELRVNLDWDAWWNLASGQRSWVRSRERLVEIRVHGDAESAAGKESGVRAREDLELLGRYWPAPIARAVQRVMSLAY